MLVLHANWSGGTLRLWGESLEHYRAFRSENSALHNTGSAEHPFVAAPSAILDFIQSVGQYQSQVSSIVMRLPREGDGPVASDRLARAALDVELMHVHARSAAASTHGDAISDSNGEAEFEGLEVAADPWLGEFTVPSLSIAPAQTLQFLTRLEDHRDRHDADFSHAVRFWIAVSEFVLDLLMDQRFIPTLVQTRDHKVIGRWQPWLHDDAARSRVAALLRSMPPIVRAVVDEHQGNSWSILNEALSAMTDTAVRHALQEENFSEAIDGRSPETDPNVAWLAGLLGDSRVVPATPVVAHDLLRDAGAWVSRLDDVGQNQPLHLCLRLNEPVTIANSPESLDPIWSLSLHLQAADDPERLLDAPEIWRSKSAGSAGALRVGDPQEILLAELGRASRIYPKIESALAESAPTEIQLTTAEAYEFLRDVRPVLEEAAVRVIVPAWWDQPAGRLTARLRVEPVESESSAGMTASAPTRLGLNSLVKFEWRIAIGDQPLTAEEFQNLARQTQPLVNVRGKWIEMSPQQLREAHEFIDQSATGEMTLLEAIQASQDAGGRPMGLPVFGMDASGWIADVLAASSDNQRMPTIDQPGDFSGDLRPYQKTGLSWLSFLDTFGLGACLADDMGLGKTIQLIALLLHERSPGDEAQRAQIGPTLLVAPTSVMSNWVRELSRFAPSLSAHLQHGPDRPLGERFIELALTKDLVITTYPLVSRDQETLQRVNWHRVVLDEAQYIKNPPTKQTTAIRALKTPRRVALTGTPVENRLSELWSIMEFCNPGYLGPAAEFRRRFALPIERHRDMRRVEQLREMVRPFVLRRVKTDPKVINDLPPCVETKEYATLTPAQAALYQYTVNSMLTEVDRSQGMQRRGMVLAALVKLKQICNHPDTGSGNGDAARLAASESEDIAQPAALSSRSGKAKRLMSMLEEVLATGEKALIFTQFRQMGHLLTAMIQHDLDREAIFLHGGTPASKRQALIDRFQDPSGGTPIFVLSLKAGGLGLNLTAANHVFHYDRWWNPAVESQATDRAFRIGQTRTVHVHKFVCVGTLEERIDQMIEQKTELAQNIIGAGEQWLTELSTGQLRDLLMLRPVALESDI